jgi:hypothetical protein
VTDSPKATKPKGRGAGAFGAPNRNRLIDEYFAKLDPKELKPSRAWAHVYRLLLWADRTTGLAHCYESDKCQPGKPWYGRSLAFHDWVSESLGSRPKDVAEEIDWLFRRVTDELAQEVLRNAEKLAAAAVRQRKPYEGRHFPRPGEDPGLIHIVREVLGEHLGKEPSAEQWQALVQRIREYLSVENKRKNLVGEGFEDVLTQVVRRTSGSPALELRTRVLLHEIPGFGREKAGEKPNKVDVAVLGPGLRTLVTAKWSVRADREKQFVTDYTEYVAAESERKPWEYVFVTNEFDPARLMRACEILTGKNVLFEHVVHINTGALKTTYGDKSDDTSKRVLELMDEGRLIGLEQWIESLRKRVG